MLLAGIRLNMTNIFVQQLQVFLTSIVTNLRTTRAFSHIECKTFRLHRLIFLSSRIEEHKFNGWYLKLSRMTRNSKNIINHRALNTIGRQLGLIRNLSIIFIEVFRERHLWLFDEFQITHTTNDHTQGDRIIGLGFSLIKLC